MGTAHVYAVNLRLRFCDGPKAGYTMAAQENKVTMGRCQGSPLSEELTWNGDLSFTFRDRKPICDNLPFPVLHEYFAVYGL